MPIQIYPPDNPHVFITSGDWSDIIKNTRTCKEGQKGEGEGLGTLRFTKFQSSIVLLHTPLHMQVCMNLLVDLVATTKVCYTTLLYLD